MELTKTDIYNIFAKISLEFKDFCNMPKSKLELRVESWYEDLKEYPKELVFKATNNVINKSEFEPRKATVLNEIKSLIQSQQKSEFELWNELESVLYYVRYYASYLQYEQHRDWANRKLDEIFRRLSKPTQHFLQDCSTLIHIANMTNEELSYEKARFLKAVKGIQEMQETRSQVQQFIALIEENKLKQIGDKQ